MLQKNPVTTSKGYIYIYYFNFRHNEIDMDIIGYRDIQYQPEQIVSRMFPST